jgi:hypothetical protein
VQRDRQQRHAAHIERPPTQESATWGLVFTEPDGGHISPQKVTDTFREAVRDAPVPIIRFHDVRHAHATLMLQAGVNPKVLSGRLGHASVKTTLDIYADVLPAMDEEAAARFEQLVWSGDRATASGESGCTKATWYVAEMIDLAVLDELNRLLDAEHGQTVNTSMRLPVGLRDAAALAVRHLDVPRSTTSLTAAALRRFLETVVMDAALEAHFEEHPEARPSLAEVALAVAEQDGSELADRPELLEQAAADILERHPDADADDVLLWAEAQLAART